MLYVLDTSVCIALIRGYSATGFLPPPEEIALSVITVAELEVGVRRSPNHYQQRETVDRFTACFNVLAFEPEAAVHYGEIRVNLERKGTPIGPMDLLIAAHARSLDATLVTANVREFQRVEGLQVLAWQ